MNTQYEFNVELRDDDDVEYALEKFEELWEMAVPISEEYINAIETKTWLNESVTPYEIYLKFLYEYYKPNNYHAPPTMAIYKLYKSNEQ